jgi:hypothetical protein
LHIPNATQGDWVADVESDIEQGNDIHYPDWPLRRDVSAVANVPKLIWPTRNSKRLAEEVFVIANAIETRKNKGVNNQ